MTEVGADRWREIDDLFAAALDCPAGERQAFVLQAAVDDPELLHEVTDLLGAFDEAQDYVERSGSRLIGRLCQDLSLQDRAPATGLEGDLLGPWRMVRRIARGGMGSVYLAERADGRFEHLAAVKVLRRGLDTEDIVARFLAERRILASLDHPNIARLLDGGETPDGRPYLVMEYVEGDPLTTHVARQRLGLDRRLALFSAVCRAVQHAHRHLVIHRDLKPSNVLVTESGEVKLLDFGIAKILDPDHPETRAGPTRTGMRLMTPRYASPEQVRGGVVTTASDVYQLGLLLYEVLTGSSPLAGNLRSRAAVEEQVLTREPTRPSRMVDEEAAEAFGITLPRLRRGLKGDLDQVVMMSLRKEPDRRYPSVEALVRDLERHRDGLPVRAAPDSTRYRVGKFVRRNRLRVTGGLAAAALVAAYAVTVTVQGRRISVERDRATVEASRANEVTAFMVNLFEGANPDLAGGGDISAGELLDLGARRAAVELTNQPEVHAALLSAIGQSYAVLGRYGDARPLLEEAIRYGGLGNDARRVRDMAALADAVFKSDMTEGLKLYRDALRTAEERLTPEHQVTGRVLAQYGEALSLGSDSVSHSRTLRERAVRILRQHPGAQADLAFALSVWAYGAPVLEAVVRMREALAIRRRLYGDRHSEVAGSLSDLALVTEPSDPLGADSLMNEAMLLFKEILGPEHGTTLRVMNNLAAMRRTRGAFAQAEPVYREVLRIRQTVYPAHRVGIAFSLYGLGVVVVGLGRAREGETHLRAALEILKEEIPPTSSLLNLNRAAIGHALTGQRRYAEAESVLLPAVTALERAGVRGLDMALNYERLAELYEAWGRSRQAGVYRSRLRELAVQDSLAQYLHESP